eukprot:gene2192-2510_t
MAQRLPVTVYVIFQHLEIKLHSQAVTHDADCCPDADSSWDKATQAVLRALPTHITSLDLLSDRYDELAEQPGLLELTALSAGRVIHSSRLQSLPDHLQHLELGICSPGVQLSHLTALTALHSPGRFLQIDTNDSLPANLRSLQVGECRSVQRLVSLKQLRQLAMGGSDIPHRRLLRLASSLTALTGESQLTVAVGSAGG